uniref:Uncharacterized protein n=1 Tax=Arundo donax TaxID=35708 RepID=A0A0A9H4K9_ARUDO
MRQEIYKSRAEGKPQHLIHFGWHHLHRHIYNKQSSLHLPESSHQQNE